MNLPRVLSGIPSEEIGNHPIVIPHMEAIGVRAGTHPETGSPIIELHVQHPDVGSVVHVLPLDGSKILLDELRRSMEALSIGNVFRPGDRNTIQFACLPKDGRSIGDWDESDLAVRVRVRHSSMKKQLVCPIPPDICSMFKRQLVRSIEIVESGGP